jgi:hypothetical protein
VGKEDSYARSRNKNRHLRKVSGGGSGIRTHGDITATPVFKTGALNRSAIPPGIDFVSFYGFPAALRKIHFATECLCSSPLPRPGSLRQPVLGLSPV